MIIVILIKKKSKNHNNTSFKKTDLVYIVSMIVLDIVAPILLLVRLEMTTASTTSLLNNFEIVFTSLIAMIFFKEIIGKRMWIAIILIFIAGVILSIDNIENLSISTGSIFVILASLALGLENNCTENAIPKRST
jgi:drug/metabolite transporter (DMT)-like permease